MKIGTIVGLAAIASATLLTRSALSDGQWALDDFDAKWIGGALQALQEPLLHDKTWDETTEVYRLVALPTFDHPISVRIVVWPTGTVAATLRSSSGRGGYDPGHLDFERATVVSPEDLQALKNAVSKIAFWSLPTKTPPTKIEHPDSMIEMIVCTDGTTVVIEAAADSRYHIIHRRCDQREQLRPVVEIFERIAGRQLMPAPLDANAP